MQCLPIFLICAALAWAAVGGAAVDAVAEQSKDAAAAPEDRINEVCRQPRVTGRCLALFHRFAFNVETRACEEFIYGGCGGNANNFSTQEECEAACLTKPEDSSTTGAPPAS